MRPMMNEEKTEIELHLVTPASRETACGLPLVGLTYATPQGFEQPHRLKRCRACSYASVVRCKGGCGRQLRWYERHDDGLCWRCNALKPTVEVDEQAGYTIYKNRVLRSAIIHRSWCRQVRRSGRFRSLVVKATGWYMDGLTTMEEAERAAGTEGWETMRRCGSCRP